MNNYDDIINLSHYEPKYHKRMSILSRASQFAPFAALNGYEDNIEEASRFVNKKNILSEEQKNRVNKVLNNIIKDSKVKIRYFIKDKNKSGGEYLTCIKDVHRIDSINKRIILNDKKSINFDDIFSIEIIDND